MSPDDLLRWLAKEDATPLGECHGPMLDALVRDGLVEITGSAVFDHYRRVHVTEKGFDRLKEISDAAH